MKRISLFFHTLGDWIQKTEIPAQFETVDAAGLFTNPWFIIPFLSLIGYLVYKQSFKDIIIFALMLGFWYLSGTDYMQSLIVEGELQLEKVLPVMIGGAAALAFAIYIFFGRSD